MRSKSCSDFHTHISALFRSCHEVITLYLWLACSPLICLHSRPIIFINSSPVMPFLSLSGTCLDGGEVAGIVIGCFLLIILLLILFIFLWRRRSGSRRRRGMFVFPIFGAFFRFNLFFINEAFFYLTSLFFIVAAQIVQKTNPEPRPVSSKQKMSLHYWKFYFILFLNSLKVMWICFTYSLYFHNCLR